MWVFAILLLLLVILLACVLAIFSLEGYVLFCPTADILTKDFGEKLEEYRVSGVTCWHFDRNYKKVIFYCHGNAGNISHRKYVIEMSKNLGYNLLLFDYRGFGSSERIGITQKTVVEDSESAFLSIAEKYEMKDIIIWGESLGSKPSSYLASKYDVGRLVIMLGFSSIEDAVNDGLSPPYNKFFSYLVRYTFRDNATNKSYLSRVKCPVMVIHNTEDELIPYENAIRNIKSVRHINKILVSIKGLHSAPSISEDKVAIVYHFLNPDRPLDKRKLKLISQVIESAADAIMMDPYAGSNNLTQIIKPDDQGMEQFRIKHDLFPRS